MKKILLALLSFFVVASLWIGNAEAQGGAGPAPGIGLKDEGVAQGRITEVNCTGAGVTCSKSGATGTINVTSGGGGGNFVAVTVSFGASGNDMVTTTVTGQSWITATSVIICVPTMLATADRADGEEDALLEGLRGLVSNRIAGTGFDLTVATDGDITMHHMPGLGATWTANPTLGARTAPAHPAEQDLAFGDFLFHCTGG